MSENYVIITLSLESKQSAYEMGGARGVTSSILSSPTPQSELNFQPSGHDGHPRII